MTAGKIQNKILVGLFLIGALLMQSCVASLVALPVTTFVGGAELAMKGGDLYVHMKKADGRKAFELTFDQTWDNTLRALKDLSLETDKTEKNEKGDGGLIEVKTLDGKLRIAVIKLSERVSEVGIWAKGDQALAALILAKTGKEDVKSDLHPELSRTSGFQDG